MLWLLIKYSSILRALKEAREKPILRTNLYPGMSFQILLGYILSAFYYAHMFDGDTT